MLRPNHESAGFPQVRLRRYRRTEPIRNLTGAGEPSLRHFIWPLVLVEGKNVRKPIIGLPGQHLLSIDSLLKELSAPGIAEIGGILLFAKLDKERKDAVGSFAWRPSGLVQEAIRRIRSEFPNLTVFSDVGLSGYTDHGNSGILDDAKQNIDNDKTLDAIANVALSHAEAGANCVAPSGMADGQVQHIRKALDGANLHQTMIMSYSAKFASDLYDTFPVWQNEAQGASERRDSFSLACPLMKTYCTAVDNLNLARREVALDVREGADIIIVKPALFYLDIVAWIKMNYDLPVGAYNVSGEYSMIHATAAEGWGSLYRLARESLLSIRRAGAEIIISYWANQYDKIFGKDK